MAAAIIQRFLNNPRPCAGASDAFRAALEGYERFKEMLLDGIQFGTVRGRKSRRMFDGTTCQWWRCATENDLRSGRGKCCVLRR